MSLSVPPDWNPCRPNSQGREAGRSSGRAVDQIRVGHQHEDGQGAWTQRTYFDAIARRRGDRVSAILLHRMSPELADIVAKVGEGHLRRNNRIGTTNSLNQHCVSALDLESILLVWVRKIFLQQYRHKPDL